MAGTRRVRAAASPAPGAGQRAAARAEPARTRTRRRLVITATGISGAALLSASLSARAGSRPFYLLTAGLAATWTGGALAAGPLTWGTTPDHDDAPHRLVVTPVLTGAGAFGLFYGAARLARRIPVLALLHWLILGQRGSVAWMVRSDGQCEVVEGVAEPVVSWDVGGDLVVAAAQVLYEGVTGGDDSC